MKSIAEAYEKKTGEKVVFTFGPSSFLEQQIEEGVQTDLFFSADEAKMDRLDQRGFLLSGSRRSLLSNILVVVVPKGSGFHMAAFKDLASSKIQRLALADPQGVPAGLYAKQYLEKMGLWAGLSRRVVPKDNVRAALSAVGSKNCDAAIVYKTDAKITKKVRIVWEVDEKDGPRISYPVAAIRSTASPDRATKFLKFLTSKEAKGVFTKFGFQHTVPPEVKKKAMDRTLGDLIVMGG
jgi:molybdate transport system substrate-binding protein